MWAGETEGNIVQFSSHAFNYYSTVEKGEKGTLALLSYL